MFWLSVLRSEPATFAVVISLRNLRPSAGFMIPCGRAFSHYSKKTMKTVICEQIERVHALTDEQKARFLRIYFHGRQHSLMSNAENLLILNDRPQCEPVGK